MSESRATVMSKVFSTADVAFVLGMRTGTLSRAIWERRVAAPPKGPGGAYHWTQEDVERASCRLLGHDLSDAAQRRLDDLRNGRKEQTGGIR